MNSLRARIKKGDTEKKKKKSRHAEKKEKRHGKLTHTHAHTHLILSHRQWPMYIPRSPVARGPPTASRPARPEGAHACA